MRKIADIKNDISARLTEAKNPDLEADKRADAVAKLRQLNEELQNASVVEATERSLANNSFNQEEQRTAQRFSFAKFLREASESNLTGLEKEMAEEAVKESQRNGQSLTGIGIPYIILANKRAAAGQNVTTAADGGNLVGKEPVTYIEALREALILNALGANFITGLVGNVPMVRGTSVNAAWNGETDSSSTTKKSTTKVEMSPKRLAITTAYSKQLLIQSSPDIEMILMMDMVAAHAVALQKAAIVGGGSNEPSGILATSGIGSVVIGDNGGAITWAKLVELETKVSTSNALLGNLAYLTNSKVAGALKTIERASNTARFIMENGEANGYKVAQTNSVPSNLSKGTGTNLSAMIFGNFNDLIVGQWGGLDIVVDPYTLKKTGEIETTINAFHDVFVRRVESFAAIKDITTL